MVETRSREQGPAGKAPKVPVANATATFKDRYAAGKALRATCPRDAHAEWKAPANRPDAVATVLEAE